MKSRAHLGLEEGVLKLVAALDSEGCLKPVGSANVPRRWCDVEKSEV
jgi:hypothetical protein